jgi:hypothetical protein
MVHAEDITIYDTAQPIIDIDYFGFNVTITNNALLDTHTGANYPLKNLTSLIGNYFTYTAYYLPNGEYTFSIGSRFIDIPIFTKLSSKTFALTHGGVGVYLIKPPLGIGKTPQYDITVGTSVNATCKYTRTMNTGCTNPACLYNAAENTFTSTGNSVTHRIVGFNAPPFTESSTAQIFAICKATVPSTTNSDDDYGALAFRVGYDNAAPQILSINADPNPIEDVNYRATTLHVTTNENAFCKITGGAGSAMLDISFDNEKQDTFTTYSKNHTIMIDYTASLPIDEVLDIPYKITCVDYAQSSTEKSYTIQYTLNSSIQITQITPKYIQTRNVNYQIQTDKPVQGCEVQVNKAYTLGLSDTGNHQNFTKQLINLSVGQNTMDVKCWVNAYGRKSFTVYVDEVNPTLEIITDHDTCGLKAMSFMFNGGDNGTSGIDHYAYAVRNSTGDVLVNTTTSDKKVTIKSSTGFVEGQEYSITAEAFDMSGRGSAEKTATITATKDNITGCDKTPPTASINVLSSTKENAKVNVSCTDNVNCTSSFGYDYLTNNTGSCKNANYQSKDYDELPLSFDQNGLLCVIVYDVNNNNDTVNKAIALNGSTPPKEDTCDNNKQDEGETDIDCGGDKCKACEVDRSCNVNLDCYSGKCSADKKCIAGPCTNGVKDGSESDVDCGGSLCTQCGIDKKCGSPLDCTSGICESGSCIENKCTNGVKDFEEGGVDCGGSCTTKCSDGNSCTADNDCSSGSCVNNTCAGQSQGTGLGTIILFAGIILFVAGAGYIAYKTFFAKSSIAPSSYSSHQQGMRNNETPQQSAHVEIMRQQKSFQKRQDRGKERKSLLGNFVDSENKEKIASEKAAPLSKHKEDAINEKSTNETTAEEEFVDIEKLKKKTPEKKDVFSKLSEVTSNNKAAKTDLSEAKNTKDVFAELGKISKHYSNDEIIQKIAQLSGKSANKVSSIIRNRTITSMDADQLFTNLTRDQIMSNEFKQIIANLVAVGKLSKESVSHILFEYMDQKLLSKREVAKILTDLKLV